MHERYLSKGSVKTAAGPSTTKTQTTTTYRQLKEAEEVIVDAEDTRDALQAKLALVHQQMRDLVHYSPACNSSYPPDSGMSSA